MGGLTNEISELESSSLLVFSIHNIDKLFANKLLFEFQN